MDDVRRQFETNVFGLVRMCQLVLPGMRAQGWGRIVNMSSMGGELHVPGRRHLPRDQVRGRGDLRRAALRGQGLRRRRDGDPARPDPHRVRRDGRRWSCRRATGRTRVQRRRGHATTDAYEKGPLARLGGEPDAVAKAVEKAITAGRAPIRVRVTPSAHLLITAAPADARPAVGRLRGHAVHAPRPLVALFMRLACAPRAGMTWASGKRQHRRPH